MTFHEYVVFAHVLYKTMFSTMAGLILEGVPGPVAVLIVTDMLAEAITTPPTT